jgi:hypothetical protein
MRGLRLVLVLVGSALVLALPASASAAVWKDGGFTVTKPIEIGLEGGDVFGLKAGTGVMYCEVSAALTTAGGSTGTITKYSLFACSGTESVANCVALAIEAKGLPWTVDVNASDLTVTDMRIRRKFTGKDCPLPETEVKWSPTFTLDVPSAISEMEFLVDNGTYFSAGALEVKSPNAGTYGIG